jgi:hypothetical protein
MVGHINAFLAIIQSAVPDLFRKFAEARVWRRNGVAIEDSLYENMSPVDFSRQVLAVEAKRLLVLRMSDVGWSDLCKPAGLLSVLHQTA